MTCWDRNTDELHCIIQLINHYNYAMSGLQTEITLLVQILKSHKTYIHPFLKQMVGNDSNQIHYIIIQTKLKIHVNW